MFKYKRLILSLFVILAIAFTWLVPFLLVHGEWSRQFWYQMAGIWVGEALLGAMIVGMADNTGRSLPLHVGNLAVGAGYLCYVFGLLSLSCSETGVLLWEIGGLLVALFLHVVFAFAQHDVKADDKAVKKAFGLRNELLSALEMLEAAQRDVIKGDPALAAEFEKLKDAARFVSDSVAGCESVDAEVRGGLSALWQCSDAAELTRAVADLTARIAVRQNTVTRLR